MVASNPPSLWAVRILTNDLLMDGFIDPKTQSTRLSVFGYRSDSTSPIWLSSVNATPVHALPAELPTPGKFTAVYFDSLVAVIPADDASTASAIKQNSSYLYPLKVDIFTGMYRIQGNVLCSDKQFNYFADTRILFLREVEIACTLPEPKLGALKAPYLLLATRQIQSLIPA
jgi:hypothetical protein